MTNLPTDEELFTTLSTILVEALLVESAKITMESRIFDDLGAESIDILDIRFRIEKAFGLKIDQDELIRSLGEGLSTSEIQERLTVRSLVAYIRNRLQQRVKTS